jgi:hypothetical protein
MSDIAISRKPAVHLYRGMTVEFLVWRDGNRCHYCRDVLDVSQMIIEHKSPIALGGDQTSPNNLVLSCNACNSLKSDTPYDKFLDKHPLGCKTPSTPTSLVGTIFNLSDKVTSFAKVVVEQLIARDQVISGFVDVVREMCPDYQVPTDMNEDKADRVRVKIMTVFGLYRATYHKDVTPWEDSIGNSSGQ